MEIVACLSNKANLPRLKDYVGGVIFGSLFSLRFHYSLKDCREIVDYCHQNDLKAYIAVDALISENDKTMMYSYFEFVRSLDVDGIYFSDLGVINIARGYGIADRLIYEADTLMTNSLDAAFFIRMGIDVVAARELEIVELTNLLKKNSGHMDMQIFGHFRMSSSKRKFLTNYQKEIDKDFDVSAKDLRIVEESRYYELPIIEDEFGTRIYTDYIFCAYEELAKLRPYIRRGIVDDTFVNQDLFFDFLADLKKLDENNARYLRNSLLNKYSSAPLSEGYLYQKTVDKK